MGCSLEGVPAMTTKGISKLLPAFHNKFSSKVLCGSGPETIPKKTMGSLSVLLMAALLIGVSISLDKQPIYHKGILGLCFGLAKMPDKLLLPSISGIQQAVKRLSHAYCIF